MKLSCLQENLNRGLNIAQRAVATRTTLPITSNILLATDQSRLKLVATNLEMAITCWIGAMVEEEGAITVPARLISEFVASLPQEKVEIEMAPNSRTLNLKCARFEARISGIDAADFPPVPAVESDVVVKIEANSLKQAIRQVVFTAALEDARPVLTGVDALFEGNSLTLAAADGFRLSVFKLPVENQIPEKVEVIIPARTFSEVEKLSTDNEPVEIIVNPRKSQILFRIKNIELVSQLVQGTFPKYTQLIPQSFATRITLDNQQFLRATRTATIFARDGSGIVRLFASPGADGATGKLVINARSEEIGENTGELDAIVEGPEARIAFNGKYLIDVLSVLKEQQVVLEITTPSSPGVIKPVGSDNYIHVVMPMFVQW